MTNNLILKYQKIRSLATFSSFNTSTEQGAAKERYRRIIQTAVASAIAKIVSMATMLISIPLTLNYLGTERFGLWMIISSVIAMLAFADLGIGNGLLNAISEANGKDDHAAIRRHISSAFLILSTIAFVILGTFSLIYPFIPWVMLFNVKSQLAMEESGVTAAVFIFCFALNIPAGIIQRVQMGLQMGFVANLWQAGASVIGLLAVLLVIYFEKGLPWLVGALAGAPIIGALLNGIHFWGYSRKELAPRIQLVSRISIKKIGHSGIMFFGLQVAGLVAFQTDVLILAHYLNPEVVAEYTIVMKVFSIPTMILGFYLAGLWPAYGEAFSRGDMNWVKHSFIKSLKYSILTNIPITFFLIIFGKFLIEKWIGTSINVTMELIVAAGCWSIIAIIGGNFGALLNGLNLMKFQTYAALLMAIANIIISIWLVKRMGVEGVIYGSVISLLIFNHIPMGILIYKYLYKIKNGCPLKI